MHWSEVSRAAVLCAIHEFDELGRDDFLGRYGFGRSTQYTLIHEGRSYDSKAIVGVAFGYEFGSDPLRPRDFSGGAEHCASLLVRLGFDVECGGESLSDRLLGCARRLVRRLRRTVGCLSAEVREILVGLVSCSKAKLKKAAPARDLYSPSFVFSRSARYVESRCDEWFVLSAKHGLVEPDTVLEPYDDTLAGAPKKVREAWASRVRAELANRFDGQRVKYILMAGSSYAGAVAGLDVEEPLRGLGTGHRRKWLAANT